MKNNWLKILGIIFLTVSVCLITVKLINPTKSTSVDTVSVYDKVLKSGVIRACYVVYPPALIKDPNTGKMSGVFVEALNKAASNMGLKVEWYAEVGWGEMIEALNTNRCDIIGSSSWTNAIRGKSAEFTKPLYYSAINAYVRADDNRFDGGLNIANDKKFKIVNIDGEASQGIALSQFPNAQTIQLTQLTDVSQLFLNVASGKADITFQEQINADLYAKNNPGKIKNISVNKPIVVYGNVMMVKKGEFTFKTMIDNALTELLDSGYVDGLINKYEADYPGGFYPVAVPYTLPNK